MFSKFNSVFFGNREKNSHEETCGEVSPFLDDVLSGTHDPEPTTLLCSCNGVFKDRFIFRLNFPRMILPQEPDHQIQEIKLTS